MKDCFISRRLHIRFITSLEPQVYFHDLLKAVKYLLIAIGTRGDIEPFLAVGEKLLARGHCVIAAFPSQFAHLARESGLHFLGLDPVFLEMIEGEIGKRVLGGSGNRMQRLIAFFQLWKLSTQVNNNLFRQQRQFIEEVSPDFIIHSLKATVPLDWGLKHKGKSILLSPIPCVVHPIKNKSSIGFRGRNMGKLLNHWSHKFMTYASVRNLRFYLKRLFQEESSQKALESIYEGETAIYTVSPNLINTSGLPGHVKFVGYLERDKQKHWQPNEALLAFIEKYPKFMLVTFGSMTNPKPVAKTKAIVKVLRELKIPAIINTAGGGLEEIAIDDESIFYTSSIPYDWILPKTYALIHHGGSGTTHLGVKYACPSLIVPHIIDQYFWSNTLHELGIGPKGISIRKLTKSKLFPLVKDLWYNEKYLIKAQQLSQKMNAEKFDHELTSILEKPISALV